MQHNPLYTAEELEPLFTDHEATVAIVWDSALATVQHLRETTALREIIAVDLTQELPPLKRRALRLPVPSLRCTSEVDHAEHGSECLYLEGLPVASSAAW